MLKLKIVISFILIFSIHQLQAKPEINSLEIRQKLAQLEKESGGRLGLAFIDTANNSEILYRAKERFPMCSTSKVMVVSSILKASERSIGLLDNKVLIKESDLVNYNPITGSYVGQEMTIAELSKAALQYSDNTAMNKLLTFVGGPMKVTKYARSIGDTKFRLDRKEPELNTAIPNDRRDTTTPLAMATSLKNITTGDVLDKQSRTILINWMKGNTTGNESIKAGIPSDWVIVDKTGAGEYGTTNDIAVIFPKHSKPIILAIYFTQPDRNAKYRKDVLAAANIVTQTIK